MLGARIAALRRAAGMSQSALAKKLLISTSAIGMYEQGRREPSIDTLAQIAKEFDVSMDFLVTGQAITEKELAKLQELLQGRIEFADQEIATRRKKYPFSREEMAVLFATMLMER